VLADIMGRGRCIDRLTVAGEMDLRVERGGEGEGKGRGQGERGGI